jgi:hypothetical protein
MIEFIDNRHMLAGCRQNSLRRFSLSQVPDTTLQWDDADIFFLFAALGLSQPRG